MKFRSSEKTQFRSSEIRSSDRLPKKLPINCQESLMKYYITIFLSPVPMQAEAPKDTMYANEHSLNIEALEKVGGSHKYSKITFLSRF